MTPITKFKDHIYHIILEVCGSQCHRRPSLKIEGEFYFPFDLSGPSLQYGRLTVDGVAAWEAAIVPVPLTCSVGISALML
jgi:hypothetical protein